MRFEYKDKVVTAVFSAELKALLQNDAARHARSISRQVRFICMQYYASQLAAQAKGDAAQAGGKG